MEPTNTRFSSHGYNYEIDEVGAVHQLDPQPYTYDAAYNATYDTPAYVKGNQLLQDMRVGFIFTGFSGVESLVDFGAGNGAFCKIAAKSIPSVKAYDLDPSPIEGIDKVDYLPSADVYTFHDALEHVPDLSFLSTLPAQGIIVSLPWCHIRSKGVEWFSDKYKHRKPNEHLHHFDDESLPATLAKYGWYKVGRACNHEDIVRRSTHGLPNILSMAFVRK